MDIWVRRGEKVESLGRLISLYREEKKRYFLVIEYLLFMIDLDFCLIDFEISKIRNLEVRIDKCGFREFFYL